MSDVRLKEIATSTEGFTGADLKALLYSAQLQAAHEALDRKKREEIEMERRPSQHSLSEISPSAALVWEGGEETSTSSARLLTFESTESGGVRDCDEDRPQALLSSKVSQKLRSRR